MGISYEILNDEKIELCRELCNELMAFQKSKATISPECFDWMNFDTRLKPSYESAKIRRLVLAKDGEKPVGYVFSSIENLESGDKSRDATPDWAPKVENSLGFYPEWDDLPDKVGCLNHLYIKDQYRGMGIGKALFDMAMEWLESFDDINLSFVYISNGNDAALKFYLNNGFKISHEVFGGFITAAYRCKG